MVDGKTLDFLRVSKDGSLVMLGFVDSSVLYINKDDNGWVFRVKAPKGTIWRHRVDEWEQISPT